MLTQHAKKRSQQRAIPMSMLHILSAYGEEVRQKGGTCLLRLNKRDVKTVRNDLKSVLKHLDSLSSAYLVETDEGVVITAGHQN